MLNEFGFEVIKWWGWEIELHKGSFTPFWVWIDDVYYEFETEDEAKEFIDKQRMD